MGTLLGFRRQHIKAVGRECPFPHSSSRVSQDGDTQYIGDAWTKEHPNRHALLVQITTENTRTHKHTHKHTHTQAHTQAHAQTRTHTNRHRHTRTDTDRKTHRHTHIRTNERTHTHARTHTRTHAHTYTNTHSRLFWIIITVLNLSVSFSDYKPSVGLAMAEQTKEKLKENKKSDNLGSAIPGKVFLWLSLSKMFSLVLFRLKLLL